MFMFHRNSNPEVHMVERALAIGVLQNQGLDYKQTMGLLKLAMNSAISLNVVKLEF